MKNKMSMSMEEYKALRPQYFDSKAIANAKAEQAILEREYKERNAPTPAQKTLDALKTQRASWKRIGRPVDGLDKQIHAIEQQQALEARKAEVQSAPEHAVTLVLLNSLKKMCQNDNTALFRAQLSYEAYLQHGDAERLKSEFKPLHDEAIQVEANRRAAADLEIARAQNEAAKASLNEVTRQVEFDSLALNMGEQS